MSKVLRVLALVGLAAAGACVSARPKPADQPGLAIPPPPAHVVPITAEPVIEPVAEVPAPPASGTGRPPAKPAPKPSAPESKAEVKEAKPETPPETPPAAPPATPAAPTPQLRTPESSGAEATVHATIERTRNLLNSIDYRYLTNVRKKAYDDAKTLASQAEEALKAGNVIFAQSMATKAETLAKELAGK